MTPFSTETLEEALTAKLMVSFGKTAAEATDGEMMRASALVLRDAMAVREVETRQKVRQQHARQVHYLSLEFLMGRSLMKNAYNLGILPQLKEALEHLGFKAADIFEIEPDAALGNGGLGRLAACYLDSMTTLEIPATGYSICYELGIFKQKIVEGQQVELPDNWKDLGAAWLMPKPAETQEVRFGGTVREFWDNGHLHIVNEDATVVQAVPCDMEIAGYGTDHVNVLRLWDARSTQPVDMSLFSRGEYLKAAEDEAMAETIAKVLYPEDNHLEGKSLRLRQQYFLCAAAIGDIVNHHMNVYGTLENLHEKVAIHINDTHPTLAIPELMRVLLDDCGYTWDRAWHIVTNTFAYTNHTVMAEALEKWDVNLVKQIVPRIFQIIVEINNRYCAGLMERNGGDSARTTRMSIIKDNQIHMATLCVMASHSVNGVSKLHSEIIKDSVFHEEYLDTPNKFKNVTNGIAYRRWLYQSNPGLTQLLRDKIGDGFLKDGSELKKLDVFADDKAVLEQLRKIKKENKERFAKFVKKKSGLILDTDSVFDAQVKRLHEYKRQHLNAMHILAQYNALLENPDMDFTPKTYIFAAKAAPGYYLAKQIIKMIWALSEEIRKNPRISDKLSVYFLENYCVTMSELLMPACDISEQISLAGTEASGTGNMKLMLNGAITLGTLDGANIEIGDAVGADNILIFGMKTEEVNTLKARGYRPEDYYNNNPIIKSCIDRMYAGINGCKFTQVADSLRTQDPYMVLADFDSYCQVQERSSKLYTDKDTWTKMSLHNIANAGIFSADRAVNEYAKDIWNI